MMQDWQSLASHGQGRPKGRFGHAATYYKVSQLGLKGNLLFITGGYLNDDSWICDLLSVKWKKVSIACTIGVKKRSHSVYVLQAFSVSTVAVFAQFQKRLCKAHSLFIIHTLKNKCCYAYLKTAYQRSPSTVASRSTV